MLRLSPEVYSGRSLASVGIAAHAIQDAKNYSPLDIRNGLVPMASIGSQLSMMLIFGGFLLNGAARTVEGAGLGFGQMILKAGIGLFAVVVLFQIVNLPVEFNASPRAPINIRSALLSAKVNIYCAYHLLVRLHGRSGIAIQVDNTEQGVEVPQQRKMTCLGETDLSPA